MNEARFDVDDPHWDPLDRQAYLKHLRHVSVPAMPANRGRLIDAFGYDVSCLIPQEKTPGLAPMLGEQMEAVTELLDDLIGR